jgi:ribosome-associated translation inhibitor RaiA
MPELYEQNAFWVDDDANDMLADDSKEEKTELTKEEPLELVVDEEDVELPIVVVEESDLNPSCEQLDIAPISVDKHICETSDPMEIVVEEFVPGSDTKLDDKEDETDDKEQKVTNWASDGDHSKFIDYIIDKKNKIPKHTGETIPGCERAKSYLKSLDTEISKAMRTDLEGIVDEQKIDEIRKSIEEMVDRLDRQINKLKKKTKKADLNIRLVSEGQCEKCSSVVPMWNDVENDKLVCMHCEAEITHEEDDDGLEKTAGTPIINVYVTAFERAVVGTIINATISGGKNIEETYDRMKNKYNFSPREELAIQQLVADYGYPVYKDRGLLNEPSDPASGNGVEFQTNYHS